MRHYLQAVKDLGTDEPLAVLAKMRATPVNDIFATGGYVREDGRMVRDSILCKSRRRRNRKINGISSKLSKQFPVTKRFGRCRKANVHS